MKKIFAGAMPILISACMLLCSCGPNDDKGGMDTDNSHGEGAVDSSRLSTFDSTGVTNTSPTDSAR